MDCRVTHPTKEQVRAYMLARGHEHRPPPAPEEIRHQLGWRLEPSEPACPLIGLYMFPATLGQLAAQAALDLCLAPWLANRALFGRPLH
jgi:hypothetical protein